MRCDASLVNMAVEVAPKTTFCQAQAVVQSQVDCRGSNGHSIPRNETRFPALFMGIFRPTNNTVTRKVRYCGEA